MPGGTYSSGEPFLGVTLLRCGSFITDALSPRLQNEAMGAQSSTSISHTRSSMDERELGSLNTNTRQYYHGPPPIFTPTPTKKHHRRAGEATRTRYGVSRAKKTDKPPPPFYGHTAIRTTATVRHLDLRALRGSIICFLYSPNWISGSWGIDFDQDHVCTAICSALVSHMEAQEAPTSWSLMVPHGPGWDTAEALGFAIECLQKYLPGVSYFIGKYDPVKVKGGGGFWLFRATQGTHEIENLYVPEAMVSMDDHNINAMLRPTGTAAPRLFLGTASAAIPVGTESSAIIEYYHQIERSDTVSESDLSRRALAGIRQSLDLLTLTTTRGAAVLFLYGTRWITGGFKEDFDGVVPWVEAVAHAANQNGRVLRISYMIPDTWLGSIMLREELRNTLWRLYPSIDLGEGQTYTCLARGGPEVCFSASQEHSVINFFAGCPGSEAPTGIEVAMVPPNIRQRLNSLTLTAEHGTNVIFLYNDVQWITGQTSPLDLGSLAQIADHRGGVSAVSIMVPDDPSNGMRAPLLLRELKQGLKRLYGEEIPLHTNTYPSAPGLTGRMFFKADIDDLKIEYGLAGAQQNETFLLSDGPLGRRSGTNSLDSEIPELPRKLSRAVIDLSNETSSNPICIVQFV